MMHRWSGWPGAWCLDCGCDDPQELALADGLEFGDDTAANFALLVAQYPGHPGLENCKEPGSKRHDPYGRKEKAGGVG